MLDLSLLGTSYTNSANQVVFIGTVDHLFTNGPVRARYVRIVLQKYLFSPPCIQVVPIICQHFCVGCCQRLQAINLLMLPVLSASVTEGTVARVWHTSEKMC